MIFYNFSSLLNILFLIISGRSVSEVDLFPKRIAYAPTKSILELYAREAAKNYRLDF